MFYAYAVTFEAKRVPTASCEVICRQAQPMSPEQVADESRQHVAVGTHGHPSGRARIPDGGERPHSIASGKGSAHWPGDVEMNRAPGRRR
jgi:hypothetical protein